MNYKIDEVRFPPTKLQRIPLQPSADLMRSHAKTGDAVRFTKMIVFNAAGDPNMVDFETADTIEIFKILYDGTAVGSVN